MSGTYDTWLVILSIGVAVIASYVALALASRVAASQGSKAARYWLNGGALAMCRPVAKCISATRRR